MEGGVNNKLMDSVDGWQRAIEARDTAKADTFLHRDYALVLVHPAEATMHRVQWLETLKDYVVHEYEVLARIADERDALAAILQRVRMRATVLGQDRSGVFVLSDLWLRSDAGTWQVWRRHSTPLSAGELPA